MNLHKVGTLLSPLFIAAFVYGSTGCVASPVDSTGSDSTNRSDSGSCIYDNGTTTNGTDQALSGTQTTSFSFDGSGNFQFQSNSEDGKWDLNPACGAWYQNNFPLSNTSIVFDAIDVVSISATLTTSAGICAEYCNAVSISSCTTNEGDSASVAACKAKAAAQQSCITQCTSSKSIIASAESLGSDAKVDPSTGFPILTFSLKFNGLQ